jgi:thiamine transport system substrate-binding protein
MGEAMHVRPPRPIRLAALAAALATATSACSLAGTSSPPAPAEGGQPPRTVVLATHDSWAMPEEVLAEFTRETGFRVKVQASGDAGTLTNKLVLTQGAPTADVAFGVDNTFASRAVEEGVFAPYTPADQPASVDRYEMPAADAAAALTPVDYGDVCVNVDDVWFAEHDLAPPRTLDDLVRPAYRGLFVTPGATTSSPGMAFLLATIARYGDGWERYWLELMENDTRITAGWTDAYTVDFTAGGGGGDRPIVLSYASSPPFTIPEGGAEPTTSALMETCYRQVEYAGVLDGAANPEGARALVDFLLSETVQEALPTSMYVFPVVAAADLPPVWARWAETAEDPWQVAPSRITEQRDEWLTAWAEITTR